MKVVRISQDSSEMYILLCQRTVQVQCSLKVNYNTLQHALLYVVLRHVYNRYYTILLVE